MSVNICLNCYLNIMHYSQFPEYCKSDWCAQYDKRPHKLLHYRLLISKRGLLQPARFFYDDSKTFEFLSNYKEHAPMLLESLKSTRIVKQMYRHDDCLLHYIIISTFENTLSNLSRYKDVSTLNGNTFLHLISSIEGYKHALVAINNCF